MAGPVSWSPEATEKLRVMIQEGNTFAEIGKALGVSRNAAIAKADRMGFRRTEKAGNPVLKPEPWRPGIDPKPTVFA